MMIYALVRTPDDGAHVYRLGEHESTADPVVVALLDGIRTAHKIPADWIDRDGWSLTVGGPLNPDAVASIGATVHDITAEV